MPSGSQNGSRVAACCLVRRARARGRYRGRPYQAYACGASPGPGQIWSSRSTTSASNCTDQRAEVRLQLLDRRRSDDRGGDDRVAQQPGQRHVRRLRAQLPAQPFIGFELVAVRLDALLRRVVGDASLGGGFEHAGEQAGVERAVRDQADAEAAQRGDHLQLHGPHGEVVQALLRRQAHEVACRGGALGEGHVPGGEVAAADVADLALADQLLHRLPDLLPRRRPVDVVHLIQVDVIGLQPPQARLAGPPDVVGRQPAVVRAESHRLVHLRGQDDVVAVPAALQPPADGLLRDAVPLLHVRRLRAAVDVGGVEEVDARIDRGVHDREAARLVHGETEVHRAEADPADQQT